MRFATVAAILVILAAPAAAQEQVTLDAVRDNTLYSEAGDLSNGAGAYLFTGRTNGSAVRRALVAFDVSGIPANATIVEATLTLSMSKTVVGSANVALHRVLAAWGEGLSNASANEGQGAAATANDATWSHRLYPGESWATAGGDFESTPSAMTSVGGTGSYSWSSEAVVSDVQGWVAGSLENHGWILVGPESGQSAKRFDSRDNPSPAVRPVLVVSYTTGTGTVDGNLPVAFGLAPNFPNPFSGSTSLTMTLDRPATVMLEVYDMLGHRVSVLAQGRLPGGTHERVFDAGDVPPGIYLARLWVDGRVVTRHMVRTP